MTRALVQTVPMKLIMVSLTTLHESNFIYSLKYLNTSDGPVLVTVNLLLRNIEEINDVKEQWKVQITFRQCWVDDRLEFYDNNGQIKYLTLRELYKIWTPDTFFKNERESHLHNFLAPNQLVRIYPDGTVLYSIRISLTLSCSMDLRHFPFDTQVCNIDLASCK